jgi:hypothetical protein
VYRNHGSLDDTEIDSVVRIIQRGLEEFGPRKGPLARTKARLATKNVKYDLPSMRDVIRDVEHEEKLRDRKLLKFGKDRGQYFCSTECSLYMDMYSTSDDALESLNLQFTYDYLQEVANSNEEMRRLININAVEAFCKAVDELEAGSSPWDAVPRAIRNMVTEKVRRINDIKECVRVYIAVAEKSRRDSRSTNLLEFVDLYERTFAKATMSGSISAKASKLLRNILKGLSKVANINAIQIIDAVRKAI